MRIGLYAYPDIGGSGRYFHDLIETLPKIGQDHDYDVYLDRSTPLRLEFKHPRLHYHFLPNYGASPWKQIQQELPRRIRRDRIDLFQTQYHRFPVGAPCQTVLILHDAIPILAPHSSIQPTGRRVARQLCLLATRLADHVIVSSRHTQRQFTEVLQMPPDKVTCIYPGCPRLFQPIPQPQARHFVQRRFRLSRPYLLSVGPLIPRKNHPLLIQAFRRRLQKTCDLVMTGRLWWGGDHLLRMIVRDPHIHYLGLVTDPELLHLYAAAEGFVYPSQEEGFGFPPLEAMACGTPVVTLKTASLPEVVGEAGLLVEPGSVRRLADALEVLVEDRRLREVLRARGFERVHQFQWEITVRQTLAVYKKVIQGR